MKVMQRKIIVIGSGLDCVVQEFARQLPEEFRHEFCFIDQDLFGYGIWLDNKKWYLASGREVRHQDITGVWNRLVDVSIDNHSERQSIEQYTCYLMDEIYSHVLNRPKDAMSNYAKQYQIDLIQTQRLQKIDSYICANAQLGWGVAQQPLIRKSMSGVRSVVERLHPKDKCRFVKEPVLFQPYIKGTNIRVHVIGQAVIACQCDSLAVDYRYDRKLKIKKVTLPAWLCQECRQITKQLNLIFSGIDLIYAKNRYYLLEVNTAPGYAFFDIDHVISHTIINNLRGQDDRSAGRKNWKIKQDRGQIN